MLREEGFRFLPRVLGGVGMIALPLVAEKAMRRVGIELHHERLVMIRKRLVDLRHVIGRDQRVLAAEEKIDRAADLARARQRARIRSEEQTSELQSLDY